MSRIDEALNRAGTGNRTALYKAAEQPVNRVDSSILEHYVPEESTASNIDAKVQRLSVPSRPDHVEWDDVRLPRDAKLVGGDLVPPIAVEQYRRLAATLDELQVERGLKTLMVCSTVPREGKTLTAANLALTLSGSYHRRVLLVDADLRRPCIHDLFGLANDVGLADFLRDDRREMPVRHLSSFLTVLCAGRTERRTSMAALASPRMSAVIHEASTQFDWVLLDTPPVGVLPDAQVVSRVAQAVLFVIAAGSTPYQLVQRSIAEVGADRIVGTILNRADAGAVRQLHYASYYSTADR